MRSCVTVFLPIYRIDNNAKHTNINIHSSIHTSCLNRPHVQMISSPYRNFAVERVASAFGILNELCQRSADIWFAARSLIRFRVVWASRRSPLRWKEHRKRPSGHSARTSVWPNRPPGMFPKSSNYQVWWRSLDGWCDRCSKTTRQARMAIFLIEGPGGSHSC